MGTFRIDVAVENPACAGARQEFRSVLVDTGAELSVFPADALEALGIERLKQQRFRQADGTVLLRWTGSARIYAVNTVATDDVVFGEPGDITLLGARSLEGLNVRIDPLSRRGLVSDRQRVTAMSSTSRSRRHPYCARSGCRTRRLST